MYNNTIARARKGSNAAFAKLGAPRVRRLIFPGQYASRSETPSNDSTSYQAVADCQTAQPASSGWHNSKNMREAHPTPKSQHYLGAADNTRAAAIRCCRAGLPCASPASSSCWAGLRSDLYNMSACLDVVLCCVSKPNTRKHTYQWF